MLADGTILACSRERNGDLFALTMGGYGLFGIILDLEVEMVSNMILKPSFEVVATQDFAQHFVKSIKRERHRTVKRTHIRQP